MTHDYPAAAELERLLHLPRVEVFSEVGSTLDLAHERAATGAPAGTLILAEAQTAGRGRQGRAWSSEPGAGIWSTLIERPADRSALDVLSLRIGLGIAQALEPLIHEPLGLKWPNDVYRGGRKLAGVLVEARWRGEEPDWVAIGVGLNCHPPGDQPNAVGLDGSGVSRNAALLAIVPALRRAASATGRLTSTELQDFAARDVARGRRIVAPMAGMVQGITAAGALIVETVAGRETIQAGSLVFEGNP
jgi:BirA family biotin operon repressor/biotin-[acetyl-CoA-carboxylase] ligase